MVRFIKPCQVKDNDAFFYQFCPPVGRADDTPAAVLERVRGPARARQLHLAA